MSSTGSSSSFDTSVSMIHCFNVVPLLLGLELSQATFFAYVLRVTIFGRRTRADDGTACPVLRSTSPIFVNITQRTVSIRFGSRKPPQLKNTCVILPSAKDALLNIEEPSVCRRSPPYRPAPPAQIVFSSSTRSNRGCAVRVDFLERPRPLGEAKAA